MYNGIGLQTARGSGTNGYVQRNLSALRFQRSNKSYEDVDREAELFEQRLGRAPNKGLLLHEKKRKIEIKCIELADLMLEQGYDEEEIKRKVASYREILKEKDPTISQVGKLDEERGKSVAETSHEIAKLNEEQQKKLRAAFGIDKKYKSGMAFNAEYHKNKITQRQEEIRNQQQKFQSKYDQVDRASSSSSSSSSGSVSSDSEVEAKKSKSKKSKAKRKKKNDSDSSSSSSSSSDSDEEEKKRKRRRRHRKKEKEAKEEVKEEPEDPNPRRGDDGFARPREPERRRSDERRGEVPQSHYDESHRRMLDYRKEHEERRRNGAYEGTRVSQYDREEHHSQRREEHRDHRREDRRDSSRDHHQDSHQDSRRERHERSRDDYGSSRSGRDYGY